MMDLGALPIGWRDLVLLVAALIGIYLVLLIMRLFQVGARRAPLEADGGPVRLVPEPPEFADLEPDEAVDAAPPPPAPRRGPAPEASFARELTRSTLETEVQRLRLEGELLRGEIARLSEEVSRLKAARNVSPLYGEAMSLAQQGMPAEGIAGHCGISIGEAELVAALAKSEAEFDRENLDEDRDDRYTNAGYPGSPGSRRAVG